MKTTIWMKKAGFITLILAFMLSPQALAADCFIDLDPFVNFASKPAGLCIIDKEYNEACVTWLSNPDNDSEQWGFLPDRTYIDGVGEVDYYQAFGSTVAVEFSKERLYDNQTVTGNMRCGDETYTFNFTPHFADYVEIAEGWLWARQNINYIIIAIIAFFVIIAVIIWMWRNA